MAALMHNGCQFFWAYPKQFFHWLCDNDLREKNSPEPLKGGVGNVQHGQGIGNSTAMGKERLSGLGVLQPN